MKAMGSFGTRIGTVCFAGWLLLAGMANAEELSKEQRTETHRFAANNSLFVLYHEMGHLLFDQMELPVLGREEDAADNMATWTLLKQNTEHSAKVLADAAQGWILSGIAYDNGKNESDYAAAHSLDKQRAYQIVCLMVGMDEETFRPVANAYRMDRDRQKRCARDYALLDRSFQNLLGESDKVKPGTDVYVTYYHADGRLKAAADAFRSSGVFNQVADALRSQFNLRNPVRFNAKRCGEANAFYDSETVEVIFCYELMQDYMDLYVESLSPQAKATPLQTGGNSRKNP